MRELRELFPGAAFFLTGSRVIGADHPDSDLDVCVLAETEGMPYELLEQMSFDKDADRIMGYDTDGLAITFRLPFQGLSLNVLVMRDREYFLKWYAATAIMLQTPADYQQREDRVSLFRAICGD